MTISCCRFVLFICRVTTEFYGYKFFLAPARLRSKEMAFSLASTNRIYDHDFPHLFHGPVIHIDE